mmetsp:Transcript_12197/g.15196  ORF Transcript_12197/g.15196 Transcript_12197/m.15196 type:complete len:208 (+) Transcript_12197:192-815(+)
MICFTYLSFGSAQSTAMGRLSIIVPFNPSIAFSASLCDKNCTKAKPAFVSEPFFLGIETWMTWPNLEKMLVRCFAGHRNERFLIIRRLLLPSPRTAASSLMSFSVLSFNRLLSVRACWSVPKVMYTLPFTVSILDKFRCILDFLTYFRSSGACIVSTLSPERTTTREGSAIFSWALCFLRARLATIGAISSSLSSSSSSATLWCFGI